MSLRPLPQLLAVTALLLPLTACGDDSTEATDGAGGTGVLAEDASLVWTATIPEDYSPVDAVAVGDVTVVSTSWSIDEDTGVTAYDAEGGVAWTYESTYGAPVLAAVGSDQVIVCSDAGAAVLSAADGSVAEEAAEGDDRCPTEPDDEAGVSVDHDDDAYAVSGTELRVSDGSDSYTITLEDADPEIWGVDGGVVTFAEDSQSLRLYA